MTRRVAALIAVVASFAGPALAQDPVVSFSESDPAMNAAIADARATLPLFLAAVLDSDGVASGNALVKVAFPTVDGQNELEHIWVMDVQRVDAARFKGLLGNDPYELGTLKLGDPVEFSQDQISDWSMISPEALLYGNYTTRVMFDQGVFGDQPFEAVFTADPVPVGWQ
jgi:uncharacterized protein YegJ (DUF2314 family)